MRLLATEKNRLACPYMLHDQGPADQLGEFQGLAGDTDKCTVEGGNFVLGDTAEEIIVITSYKDGSIKFKKNNLMTTFNTKQLTDEDQIQWQ